MSPFWRPISCAGELSITLSTTFLENPTLLKYKANISMAKTTFINAPARITEILLRGDLLEKLLSSSTASSSPIIFTYPPIGRSLNEYWVSFPLCEKTSGPIPIENSSTLIPLTLAIIKCPSSCTITSKLKPKIAITIYNQFNS